MESGCEGAGDVFFESVAGLGLEPQLKKESMVLSFGSVVVSGWHSLVW